MKSDMKTMRLLTSITKVSLEDSMRALDQSNNNIDEAIKLLKEQGKIPPEEADKLLEERNSQSTASVRCPKCGSEKIQLQKRGWKITTGFLGSGKNERVCMNCMYKW